MTSYFDDKAREISDAARANDFVSAADVEDQVIADVWLVTGDREFPDDLRERANRLIATLRVRSVPSTMPSKGEQVLRAAKRSSLVDALHNLFHEVGRRRVETRFGRLADNPRAFLIARAASLEERQGVEEVNA